MTDDLDHASRAGRRAANRARIRRITFGLEDEAAILADGALVPRSARLAPDEHWRPPLEPAPDETAPAGEVDGAANVPSIVDTAPAAAAEPEQPQADRPRERRWPVRLFASRAQTASWLDRILVLIEVLAMLGLVAAAFTSFGLVDRLQSDLARLTGPRRATATPAATRPATATLGLTSSPQPTATATVAPSPSATVRPTEAVLPGGRNSAQPAATEAAPPVSLVGARILIPAIRVDAPIVEGDDWERLKSGVGHHIGSALPGEAGNLVLSGHNDVYGSVFADLSELREGDLVLIDTPSRSFRYKVTGTQIVLPNETSVMDATEEPALTLISCYPPLVDSHRIVVSAMLSK